MKSKSSNCNPSWRKPAGKVGIPQAASELGCSAKYLYLLVSGRVACSSDFYIRYLNLAERMPLSFEIPEPSEYRRDRMMLRILSKLDQILAAEPAPKAAAEPPITREESLALTGLPFASERQICLAKTGLPFPSVSKVESAPPAHDPALAGAARERAGEELNGS